MSENSLQYGIMDLKNMEDSAPRIAGCRTLATKEQSSKLTGLHNTA